MPKTCPTCGGARRVQQRVRRSWWQAVLLRPTTVDELCGECVGSGVVRGTPEEEMEFERQRQRNVEERDRKAAAEKAELELRRKRRQEQQSTNPNPSRTPPSAQKAGMFDPAFLKINFGLTRYDDGAWQFEGRTTEEFAKALTNPDDCVRLLRQVASNAHVDTFCIAFGPPPARSLSIIINAKPPASLATSLSGVSAMADLIGAFARSGARTFVDDRSGLRNTGLVVIQL